MTLCKNAAPLPEGGGALSCAPERGRGEALPLAFPAPGEVLRASPDLIPLDIARVIY